MIYRTNIRNKEQLSQLGFGCMRFDKDDNEVERQLAYAIENGVNYFDTAYAYPKNEERLGRALQKIGMRQKINIATKMPTYLITKNEGFNKIVELHVAAINKYINKYK